MLRGSQAGDRSANRASMGQGNRPTEASRRVRCPALLLSRGEVARERGHRCARPCVSRSEMIRTQQNRSRVAPNPTGTRLTSPPRNTQGARASTGQGAQARPGPRVSQNLTPIPEPISRRLGRGTTVAQRRPPAHWADCPHHCERTFLDLARTRCHEGEAERTGIKVFFFQIKIECGLPHRCQRRKGEAKNTSLFYYSTIYNMYLHMYNIHVRS